MKKLIILFLAAIIVIVPFSSSYGEEFSLLNKYFDNDIMLENLTEKYASLLETQEDDLEFYENYRINRRSTYNTAISYAAKENGLKQVEWNIQNALYDLNERETLLEINFRNNLLSVFNKEIVSDSAYKAKNETLEQYKEVVSNHSKGYVSDIDLLEAEYNNKKAENTYLSAFRSHMSSLRAFNNTLDGTLDNYDYKSEFELNELPLQTAELNTYIDSALGNSQLITLTSQSISRYETELKYLNQYVMSDNISYIREKRESVTLNLALQKLTLEKHKIDLIKNIEDQYNNLMIEKEKIGLAGLSLEIAETDSVINKDLYKRGLIDYSELTDSLEEMHSREIDYKLAVFDFNTMVMGLELNCAYFMAEDNE